MSILSEMRHSADLKRKTIERLEQVDELAVFEEISRYLDPLPATSHNDGEPTEEQLILLRQAQENVRRGLYLTHEHMEILVRSWHGG
jgi:hypothetical protein